MTRKCEICLSEFKTDKKDRKYCFYCSPKTNKKNKETQVSNKVAIRQAQKKELVKLLGKKCLHCGFEGHQAAFDLHHIDEDNKSFGISKDGYTRGWKNVLLETKKCALLCKNCHALHHIGEITVDFSKQDYSLLENRIALIKEKEKVKNSPKQKMKVKQEAYCSICGIKIYKYTKSGLCNDCARKKTRVVKERPNPHQLAKEIIETSFVEVGRHYGVSDNSIRKWCKSYGIPHKKKELKKWFLKHYVSEK